MQGAFRAKEYMLTGKKMSAQKAYELGFVSALVENEQELDAKVNEYVEELLSSAPTAMADIKHLVNHVSSHSHEDNLNEVHTFVNYYLLFIFICINYSYYL